MLHFVTKLGSLSNSNKPTLFASYSKRPGKDTQGGTLPGQIFMHWDFDVLEEQVDNQKFLQQTLLYFSHEVAHFFQASLSFANSSEAWIHKDSAELFAMNALRELYPSSNAFVDLRQTKARDQCIEGLTTISLANASKNGKFSMHYDCGGLIHQRIEDELSNLEPPQTLSALWLQYRQRVLSAAGASQATFLEAV